MNMKVETLNDLAGQKKLICFDLDGTLCQHKTHLPQANKDVFKRLDQKYKVIMVGAGNAPRIYNQMEQYPVDIVANYGMQESTVVDGELKIIREDTSVPDKEYFNNIALLYAVCGICTLYDGIFPGKTGLPHLYDTAVASALHG